MGMRSDDATQRPAKGRPQTRPSEPAILAAALEAFGSKGFNGSSMRDIARLAGTSLANLYNYVPSKGHLLATVLQQANDDLLAELRAGVPAGGTDAERLTRAVTAYVQWTARSQLAGVVALSEFRYLEGEQRAAVVAARDTTEAIFTEIVEHGVAAGEFGTPHPHLAARNIVLTCAALATWYRADGPEGADVVAAQQAHLAVALVEPTDESLKDAKTPDRRRPAQRHT